MITTTQVAYDQKELRSIIILPDEVRHLPIDGITIIYQDQTKEDGVHSTYQVPKDAHILFSFIQERTST